ncbi:NAD-dependent epimerase/dehydratase family protein [Thermophagus xiamenensis]|uniref:Nucleoside-diphosphate-sugar epimerase n=1 Tax=Thermophagus xiamenensis TaxID=385682 RepID=A0A1I1X6V2_9BACT|nr:NAD-dependent epimerase/dehydratase family protein [Thermophagus xiamenensis]SFE02338.1 Nucleoside-diphosphate-sugar epimerase [Thermophagus xiamenensis]
MILLTGATGLVGTHILFSLTSKGFKVRAAKRSSSDLKHVENIFVYYAGDKGLSLLQMVEWVDTDLEDYFSLEEALEGVDYVIHGAAKVSFNPLEAGRMLKVNAGGTANLVNACLNKGVKKLIYVSSISSLGRHPDGKEVDENVEWQPDENRSAYSHSKFRAEMEVWRASKEGLPVVIVNPSVVIGPVDWRRSSGRLFYSVRKGMPFYTYGVTGFVDVRDVAESIFLLLRSDVVNERFILNGENLSFKEFFTKVAHALGKRPPFINATPWMAEIGWRLNHFFCLLVGKAPAITKDTAHAAHNKSYYSAAKFSQKFNFSFRSIDDAIENTVKWYNTRQ